MRRSLVASLLVLAAACEGERSFEAPLVLGGEAIAPEVLNRGEFTYMRYCRQCHGQSGRGDGAYASSLPVRPTDLTRGEYPRLGATGGVLPSDADLSRVIREGIDGTPMGPQPPRGEELEALVHYLKTLAPVWRGAPASARERETRRSAATP